MSSPAYFSFPRQWNAQDLANAVPRRLRLSQMVDFDAVREGAVANANSLRHASRALERGYLRNAELPPLFRVRCSAAAALMSGLRRQLWGQYGRGAWRGR